MTENEEVNNFEIFRDHLSASFIERLAPAAVKAPRRRTGKARRKEIKPVSIVVGEDEQLNDAAELSDFTEYLAEEIFLSLPKDLRTISYAFVQDNPEAAEKYTLPLESNVLEAIVTSFQPSISDSLCSYGLIDEPSDQERFLDTVLTNYISSATSAPPEYTPAVTASRPRGCEICGREYIPLTYHHLIPRQTHIKALKRGWHKEWELQKVAWLCRACHSYVHRIATNEELARELYDVELLLERHDVQKFAAWVGRVRWKAR